MHSFALASVVGICNFVIFHNIKFSRHIWDWCCHLAVENGS